MSYYFQHSLFTDGEKFHIGQSESEALSTLQDEWGVDLDDVIRLCLSGHIWMQKEPTQ